MFIIYYTNEMRMTVNKLDNSLLGMADSGIRNVSSPAKSLNSAERGLESTN